MAIWGRREFAPSALFFASRAAAIRNEPVCMAPIETTPGCYCAKFSFARAGAAIFFVSTRICVFLLLTTTLQGGTNSTMLPILPTPATPWRHFGEWRVIHRCYSRLTHAERVRRSKWGNRNRIIERAHIRPLPGGYR